MDPDPPHAIAETFGIDRSRTAEALAAALRGEAQPLRRFGVLIRVPWWRRRLQARLAPRRYRLWAQRETLRQIDAASA